MLAILKRELKVYYTSLFAYVYYAIFFFVTGIFFAASCLESYSTEFGYYVIGVVFYVMVVILPFCTMKLFAMERKHKTDQLLFTSPVSSFSVLAAKYFATVIFTLAPLALSCIYPIVISMHGTMSVKFVMASYIGCVLSVLVLLSVGMFISTLTTNVVLAVVISYAIYAVTILGRVAEAIVASGDFYDLIHETSVYNKFNDMISGIVRSGDIVYLLILTIVFFLLAWIVLESRRQDTKKMIIFAVVVVCFGGVVSFVSFKHTKVYDFTAENLLTMSEQTKEIVEGIDQPTTIYYLGKESTANATYREFFDKYKSFNDHIEVVYKDIAMDTEFQLKYLSNVYEINEASLVVVSGDKYIYLDSSDYVKISQESNYSSTSSLEIESQLTSAIYYVNQEESTKVAVVSGHSEESFNSDFSNMLYMNGYEVDTIDLPSKVGTLHAAFSDQYEAVIVNAPQTDYTEEEIAEFEDYINDGGNLFVVLDPLNEDTENLFKFLKEYGLDVQSGVVIERQQGMYTEDTLYYLVPQLQDNVFTKDIIDKNLTIYQMTSKGILPNGSGNGYTSVDILMTSGKSFSKTNDFENLDADGENDIGGPFSVASCATNPEEGNIFLVTSNVFFNEQADVASSGANRKLFLEVMKQLTDAESTIWIDGKVVGDQVALYPYNSRNTIKVVTIGVIPCVIVLLGIIIVLIRNNNIVYRIMKKRNDNESKAENQESEAKKRESEKAE